jgi:hypothetical protein
MNKPRGLGPFLYGPRALRYAARYALGPQQLKKAAAVCGLRPHYFTSLVQKDFWIF